MSSPPLRKTRSVRGAFMSSSVTTSQPGGSSSTENADEKIHIKSGDLRVQSPNLEMCKQFKLKLNIHYLKTPKRVVSIQYQSWSRISKTETASYISIIGILSKRSRISLTNAPAYILLTLTRLELTPLTKSPLTPETLQLVNNYKLDGVGPVGNRHSTD